MSATGADVSCSVLTTTTARAWTIVLALAGGLLTDAAFPGRNWWWAAPVGLALLAFGLGRPGARWAAVVGFVWGLAFFFPHLYWLDASVGAVPWVALVVVESLFIAAFAAAWVWTRRARVVRRRAWAAVAAFATLWVVVEQARSVFPFGGFPWGRLAFSQTAAPSVALASLGGAPLVSFAVAAAAGALAWSVVHALAEARHRGGAPRGRASLVALAVGVAVMLVGGLLPLPSGGEVPAGAPAPGPRDPGHPESTLRVAAVQGNVARPGLDAFEHRLEVLENHVDGTRAVTERVGPGALDVILWPENAADVDPRADAVSRALVAEAAEIADTPILVGTLRYDDAGRYNDALLWTPAAGPVAVYTKQHPAPFGEYIPMRGFARLFSDKVDLVGTDMLPGDSVGLVPLEVPRLGRSVGIADAICFEVAYDGLVREAVLAGGEIIVVQTNNASFGPTQESAQQLAMTRLRAVEHGRTAVQVSTVGESGIFAPDGAVLARTELFTAAQMVEDVPLRSTVTLADRLGVWPVWLATVASAALLVAGLRAPRPAASADRSSLSGRVPGRATDKGPSGWGPTTAHRGGDR